MYKVFNIIYDTKVFFIFIHRGFLFSYVDEKDIFSMILLLRYRCQSNSPARVLPTLSAVPKGEKDMHQDHF